MNELEYCLNNKMKLRIFQKYNYDAKFPYYILSDIL